MRGYYADAAFPPRNQPNFRFHAGDGLTGGLPDVGTELSFVRGLIREGGRKAAVTRISLQGAVIAVSVELGTSVLPTNLPKKSRDRP